MMRSEASLTGNKMKPSKQRKLDRQSCMKSYDHNLIVWIRDCYNVSITSDEIGLKKISKWNLFAHLGLFLLLLAFLKISARSKRRPTESKQMWTPVMQRWDLQTHTKTNQSQRQQNNEISYLKWTHLVPAISVCLRSQKKRRREA